MRVVALLALAAGATPLPVPPSYTFMRYASEELFGDAGLPLPDAFSDSATATVRAARWAANLVECEARLDKSADAWARAVAYIASIVVVIPMLFHFARACWSAPTPRSVPRGLSLALLLALAPPAGGQNVTACVGSWKTPASNSSAFCFLGVKTASLYSLALAGCNALPTSGMLGAASTLASVHSE